MAEIYIPVAVAELVDKVSILSIKAERIKDAAKRANILAELDMLRAIAGRCGFDGGSVLERELLEINVALWEAEEGTRACEAAGDFGERFIAHARSIYRNNDRRAALKRRINMATGSVIVEEKSY
jgi:hypothetical protein